MADGFVAWRSPRQRGAQLPDGMRRDTHAMTPYEAMVFHKMISREGSLAAIPIFESKICKPGEVLVIGDINWPSTMRFVVDDYLRFKVRYELWYWMNEQFSAAYDRLGLEPPLRMQVVR